MESIQRTQSKGASKMISFLLRTTGQALITTGIRYAVGNEKVRAKIGGVFKRTKKPVSKQIKDIEEKLRDVEGFINDTHQRLDEMENYNADHFKSMRDPIPSEIHDPETGEILESDNSQREQDFRSAEEAHWAKVRNS